MTNLKAKQYVDGACEDDYAVDDDLISLNDDYMSDNSESSSSNKNKMPLATTAAATKKTNNFFQMTAQHFKKLFSSKKQPQSAQTITKITRTTTTTTTTMKAAIRHDNDELSDYEDIHSTSKVNRKKLVRYHLHHHQRPKHLHQIHHRIPFHQKVNTKNFKLVQVKLERTASCLNAFNAHSNVNNNSLSASLFGFTIVGYCPCQTGKVEHNSPAALAGLLSGDLIIKINGKNVSRATCDSIVKIIKNLTDQYLVLDVYRVKKTTTTNSKNSFVSSFNEYQKFDSNRLHKSTKKQIEPQHQQLSTHVSSTMARLSTLSSKQHKKEMIINKTAAFLKEQQYHHRQFITTNNKYVKSIKQQEQFINSNKLNDDNHNNDKEEIDEDEIILAEAEAVAAAVEAVDSSAIHSMPSPIPYLPPIKHTNTNNMNKKKNQLDNDSSDDESSVNDVDSDSDDYDSNRKYLMNHHEFYYHQTSKKRSSITDSDYKTQSSTTATDNDADTPKQQKQDDLKYLDVDSHMNECEKLFRLEEEFISLMQSGVQQYSRPLRHLMMISQLEHHLLFQNIEKILVLSEYQLNQLISHDESTLIEMFNTIGKLYENKMRMSCEAFDIYLNGIENSFNLLISLIKNNSNNKKFNKFLYESKNEMDLKTFLLLPLYYVSSIYKSLKQIRTKITTNNTDYVPLTNLITSLDAHVNKANIILSKYDAQANKNPLVASTSANSSSLSSSLSVSSQQEDLIHSGTLRYKHKLITMSLYKNRVHLSGGDLHQVVYLSQVYKLNFNLANKLEFQFSYAIGGGEQENTIRLRAHSIHEKHEWNKLLTAF